MGKQDAFRWNLRFAARRSVEKRFRKHLRNSRTRAISWPARWCSTAWEWKPNRDTGDGYPSCPPTPPYMRVRIRRFSELSPRGPEVRGVVRHKGFAAPQVSVSASPSSDPVKLSRSWLAGAVPPVSSTFYYSLSLFGPSSLAWVLRPLLTSAAGSEWITSPSVVNPRRAADLPW